ncbi:MAG: hypothetical protein Q8903_08275 [Bacteroidota bacterium]|nr:hypothetical protein [Bacteroidota bacterium]
MARIKNVEAYCNVCDAIKKMEITGEIASDENKRWAKCKKCKQTMVIDIAVKVKEEAPSLDNVENENASDYSPKETYEVGQAIYHKNWDDFGKVTSKEIMSNGKSSIVVEFKKSGTKKLVESL